MSADPVRLWRFHLPSGRGEGLERFEWGTFVIGSDGYFSCVTDWGNYAFRWTAMACDVREFLQRAVEDPDYFVGKLSDNEYDGEATVERIMEKAKESGFDGRELRELDASLSDVEDSRDWFAIWCATNPFASRIPDAHDCFTMRRDRACESMVKRLMPRLAVLLRASLEAERVVASASGWTSPSPQEAARLSDDGGRAFAELRERARLRERTAEDLVEKVVGLRRHMRALDSERRAACEARSLLEEERDALAAEVAYLTSKVAGLRARVADLRWALAVVIRRLSPGVRPKKHGPSIGWLIRQTGRVVERYSGLPTFVRGAVEAARAAERARAQGRAGEASSDG